MKQKLPTSTSHARPASLPVSTMGRLMHIASTLRQVRKARREPNQDARSRTRAHVAAHLGHLKGLAQKIGQAAACASEEGDESLRSVCEDSEPVDVSIILECLKSAWSCDPQTVFAQIDSHGKAASLAQVHHALLRDNRDVAIKVQYPGIRQALTRDLRLARLAFGAASWMGFKFEAATYDRVLKNSLLGELDYTEEARAQLEYRLAVESLKQPVSVPYTIPELSGTNVLVSQWLGGETVERVCATWSDSDKQQAAHVLTVHVLSMVLRFGYVHGDLHPGNLRFLRNQRGISLVLYDFGSICRLTLEAQAGLRQCLTHPDVVVSNPIPAFVSMGFRSDLLVPMTHTLGKFAAILLEPFLSKHPVDLRNWELSRRSAEILGEDRWNFRAAAPPSLLLLMRVLHGHVNLVRKLSPTLNWRKCLCEALEGTAWSPASALLSTNDVPRSELPDGAAKSLCIEVLEHGELRVRLRLEASTLGDVDIWLTPDLEQKIRAQGLDPRAIAMESIRTGHRPGALFSHDENGKNIRVYLA